MLIAVLVLSTVGCTAEPLTADQKNVPEVGEEVRALRVPLDEYTLSTLDLQTIEYAEDFLTRDCMRDLDMDWKILPPPSNQDPDPLNVEPEIATRFGYHLPASITGVDGARIGVGATGPAPARRAARCLR